VIINARVRAHTSARAELRAPTRVIAITRIRAYARIMIMNLFMIFIIFILNLMEAAFKRDFRCELKGLLVRIKRTFGANC